MEIKTDNQKSELVYLNLSSINENLKSINEKLNKEKNKDNNLKWFAETFLVPISIALLSFFVAQSSNKISAAQIESSRKQAETEKRLGYLEIFMDEVSNNTQPSRQITALQLLHQMEPEIGKMLADAIQKNPDNSFDVRFAAAKVDAKLNSSQLRNKLNNFRIVLYFPNWIEAKRREALELVNIIKEIGINAVEVKPAEQSFYTKNRTPRGYEIRYDRGIELEQAKALAELLAFVTPNNNFKLVATVPNVSKAAITIFLPIN